MAESIMEMEAKDSLQKIIEDLLELMNCMGIADSSNNNGKYSPHVINSMIHINSARTELRKSLECLERKLSS